MTLFRFLSAAIAAALLLCAFASGAAFAGSHKPSAPKPTAANPIVVMNVAHDGKPMGKILIKLFPKQAPISTANFVKLVNNKFYDGLKFHRVTDLGSRDNSSPGRIAQAGDPNGDGSGGPGYTIKGEFPSNGVKNELKHNAGAVAMARTSEPDSAGSQFYICVNPVHDLDGDYAVFGQVIQGLDVAAKLQVGDRMTTVYMMK